MAGVPTAQVDDFYAGKRSPAVPLIINDSVKILVGPAIGRYAAVISIETPAPNASYLVEFGDDGSEAVLPAEHLELVPEPPA